MRIGILLPLIFLGMACSKSKTPAITSCDQQMIEKFKDQLDCKNPHQIVSKLQKGVYERQIIYFLGMTCTNCSIDLLFTGLKCDGTEVTITAPGKITNIETLDSCRGNMGPVD